MTLGLKVPGRAIVRAPIAPMYAEPYVASTQISQRLAGHPVELLEAQDDWFLARGVDKYEGWIHHGFLSPAPDSNARRSSQVAGSRWNSPKVKPRPSTGRRILPEKAIFDRSLTPN